MDRAKTLFVIDADTKQRREIGRIPNGQINSVNADETLLLGFVAYDSQPLQPTVPDPRNRRFDQAEYEANGPDGKPLNFARAKGVRMLQRWAAGYPMEIFVIDLATGERRVIHKTTEWIGHTQFSPTDPQQIIFCHEGPWHRVDRMWAIRADGTGLRKTHQRTMNFEIFGHEWFSPDGKQVLYDLQTPRGQVFWVASVDLETGRRVYRRVEQNDWSVHYNVSPDGSLFAGDGGDGDMVAHAPRRQMDRPAAARTDRRRRSVQRQGRPDLRGISALGTSGGPVEPRLPAGAQPDLHAGRQMDRLRVEHARRQSRLCGRSGAQKLNAIGKSSMQII